MAPQRLEKIESAPGNGMGPEASKIQHLVRGRLTVRSGFAREIFHFAGQRDLRSGDARMLRFRFSFMHVLGLDPRRARRTAAETARTFNVSTLVDINILYLMTSDSAGFGCVTSRTE